MSAGRRVRIAAFRWGEPVPAPDGRLEWFDPNSVSRYDPPVELRLKHGGPRVGETVRWLPVPALGMDALADIDQTGIGDAVLDLLDRNGGWLPISPGWLGVAGDGAATRGGRRWLRCRLTELSVVHAGALPWAVMRRVGSCG